MYSGSDFQLALVAYRTTPHETTGVSPAHLLMGRRLRTRLPALSLKVGPVLVAEGRVKEIDTANKLKQAKRYNRRNGVKSLNALEPGDSVLVWDLQTRTWRISETLVKRLGERSYLVRLNSGRQYLRNRFQIQVRPGCVNEINDNDDCCYHECSTIGGEVEGYHGDAVVEREASQGQKSGRIVRLPFWHKDYVLEQN